MAHAPKSSSYEGYTTRRLPPTITKHLFQQSMVNSKQTKFRDNLFKFTHVGVLQTTTINGRVSFIDLYLVFPRNFRIVFLPHTNNVILLERYCGTITEPGLPVFKQCYITHRPSISNSASVIQT